MIRIVITGTRDWIDVDLVVNYMRRLPRSAIILHGANGVVDRQADSLARHFEFEGVEPYPANWGEKGKAAGPIRNQIMVDKADACVAFWDGISKGTQDTLRRAIKKGIPCYIVFSKATARVTGEKVRIIRHGDQITSIPL